MTMHSLNEDSNHMGTGCALRLPPKKRYKFRTKNSNKVFRTFSKLRRTAFNKNTRNCVSALIRGVKTITLFDASHKHAENRVSLPAMSQDLNTGIITMSHLPVE
eukprot:gb/GEZJ01007513.1/.p2 GENE.gb/GEZJ01007513.1/~~gb/GEZJ01007513.1/.p2  ORF type:complete len:104 (-),score=10.85 gb/GEZJ01007513.1/:380-691(-)